MSEVHTLNAFTTPIFALKYNECDELQRKIISTFQELEDKDTNRFPYENGYTSYNPTANVLFLDELNHLQRFIETSMNQIHERMEFQRPITLINSWFSIGRKYSMHERHNHLPSIWSGVYYVQANNDSGNITFFNEHLKSNWPYEEPNLHNPLSRNIFTVQPETGLMLIFPSYLEHQVHLNHTDEERITISFNFGHRGS